MKNSIKVLLTVSILFTASTEELYAQDIFGSVGYATKEDWYVVASEEGTSAQGPHGYYFGTTSDFDNPRIFKGNYEDHTLYFNAYGSERLRLADTNILGTRPLQIEYTAPDIVLKDMDAVADADASSLIRWKNNDDTELGHIGFYQGRFQMSGATLNNSIDLKSAITMRVDSIVKIGANVEAITNTATLAVAGNIDAPEINVTLNGFVDATPPPGAIDSEKRKHPIKRWPDYVFKADYDLINLENVASYIRDNGHLPEVPTADEISKKGINLGEMNVLLLKKVEELTLYLIEQDKKIKDLTTKIK